VDNAEADVQAITVLLRGRPEYGAMDAARAKVDGGVDRVFRQLGKLKGL